MSVVIFYNRKFAEFHPGSLIKLLLTFKQLDMKTILVLTDFSNSAKNAAETAIVIAKKLNADILLLNAHSAIPENSLVFSNEMIADDGFFPLSDGYDLQIEENRVNELLAMGQGGGKMPDLYSISTEGLLSAGVSNVLKRHNIAMIVMGGHSNAIENRIFSSDIYAVLNKANCPVLIVPEEKIGLNAKDIVFVTDLPLADVKAIKYLVKLSEVFNFNIHLCQIANEVIITDLIESEDLSGFTKTVSKLKLKNLSFKNLLNNNFVKELEVPGEPVSADVLAMVHKKPYLFWRLFNDLHSKIIVKNPRIPILIFPEQWGT